MNLPQAIVISSSILAYAALAWRARWSPIDAGAFVSAVYLCAEVSAWLAQ